MSNNITVSFKVWKPSYDYVKRYKLENKGQKPTTVPINGTKTSFKNWKDSFLRVRKFKQNNKKYPLTVRVTIPDTPKPIADDGIIPVYHFNQQNIGNGYGEYACGPTSALICASHYDLVNYDNFLSKAYGLINACGTKIGSGTVPNNLVNGFNKYFTSLKMTPIGFTESNIKKCVKKNLPMVFNAKMNKDFGYNSFKEGHYLSITGYKNSKVGVSDPHGFNIGRGYRYYYNFNDIKKAVQNNGNRPLWIVTKK
ncbi:hypothetical protein SDC9_07398 [bioreactor metagenome]|uniref:Peptidase C39-like domain-containing protein n=1 Tax=bioreactor metagenome TaxID=1076179 RepID=A0A644T4X3_9ZZZZ|nr:C39 family peptidase [Methanobrevibacter sp.]MEA4956853.1 C39 family peptidase [Methanobrevibacter sp.]